MDTRNEFKESNTLTGYILYLKPRKNDHLGDRLFRGRSDRFEMELNRQGTDSHEQNSRRSSTGHHLIACVLEIELAGP
jgi:hypothetical protein